jgi:hypothetical protein
MKLQMHESLTLSGCVLDIWIMSHQPFHPCLGTRNASCVRMFIRCIAGLKLRVILCRAGRDHSFARLLYLLLRFNSIVGRVREKG